MEKITQEQLEKIMKDEEMVLVEHKGKSYMFENYLGQDFHVEVE